MGLAWMGNCNAQMFNSLFNWSTRANEFLSLFRATLSSPRCFPMSSDGGTSCIPFPVLNPAQRTNERTNDCIGNNEREQSASRVIDPPLHAAWYLGRGWPLVRLPKTFLFFLLGPRDSGTTEFEGDGNAHRAPACAKLVSPREITPSGFQESAFRAFKTGSDPFEETDIFDERTNQRMDGWMDGRTIRRDATRTRRASTMVSGFRARGGIDRTRARTSPSDLFKVLYDHHSGPRVHFIYDDETKPRRSENARGRRPLKKEGDLSIIYTRDANKARKYARQTRFVSQHDFIPSERGNLLFRYVKIDGRNHYSQLDYFTNKRYAFDFVNRIGFNWKYFKSY